MDTDGLLTLLLRNDHLDKDAQVQSSRLFSGDEEDIRRFRSDISTVCRSCYRQSSLVHYGMK